MTQQDYESGWKDALTWAHAKIVQDAERVADLHKLTKTSVMGGPTAEHYRLLGESRALLRTATVLFNGATKPSEHASGAYRPERYPTSAQLSALFGRYVRHVVEREGFDCLSDGTFSASEAALIRELAWPDRHPTSAQSSPVQPGHPTAKPLK